jgi:lipoteichoic acid synthase
MNYNKYNIFSVILSFFVITRILFSLELESSIFSTGMLFDIFIFSSISYLILKLPLPLLFSRLSALLIALIFLSVCIVDSIYFKYFEMLFSKNDIAGIEWLRQGHSEYDLQVSSFIFISSLLYLGASILIFKLDKKIPKSKYSYLFSVLFIIPLISIGITSNQKYDSNFEYYKSNKFLFDDKKECVKYLDRFGYSIYRITDIALETKEFEGKDNFDKIYYHFNNGKVKQKNPMSGKYKNYNLITILAESLDTRFVTPELTPNLYKLINRSMTFNNYFTPVFQQGATCNSEFMLVTGITSTPVSGWGNNMCNVYPDNIFPFSIANQLKENGYNTYYFHSYSSKFYNRNKIIPNYGFEVYKFPHNLRKVTSRKDSSIINFFDTYVDYSKPFYVDTLTYSMHGGYKADYPHHAEKVDKYFEGQEVEKEIKMYTRKIVEFDVFIGKLLQKLKDEKVIDNTLIAIFPDHHLYLMSRNIYLKHLKKLNLPAKGKEIHRQKLIIYDGSNEKIVSDKPGSTIDLCPTLLNMLGVKANYDYFFGQDIFEKKNNYILFPNKTITDGENWLYLNGKYKGDSNKIEDMKDALKSKVEDLEIQKEILKTDFFKTLIKPKEN